VSSSSYSETFSLSYVDTLRCGLAMSLPNEFLSPALRRIRSRFGKRSIARTRSHGVD